VPADSEYTGSKSGAAVSLGKNDGPHLLGCTRRWDCEICGAVRTWVPGEEGLRELVGRIG